jgi:hypothetical protein
MSNFRPINRDTGFLLPPSVDEWLPQRHLARFVVEVIDGLDLSGLVKAYRLYRSQRKRLNIWRCCSSEWLSIRQ